MIGARTPSRRRPIGSSRLYLPASFRLTPEPPRPQRWPRVALAYVATCAAIHIITKIFEGYPWAP